jgi:hypothetical protein
LEHSTQPTFTRLPPQNSSQPEPHNKWTTVSNKRGRPIQEEAPREAKHTKESDHWLKPTSTHNPYSALMEDESEDQQQTTDPGNSSKPPTFYISDVTTVQPLIRLLEQIAKLRYEIKALARSKFGIKLLNLVEQTKKPVPRNSRHSIHTNQRNEITE